MLDLIVEFFPWDWILWTMQEKIKKLVFNYLTRVTNRGESIVVGSLIISSSLNHEFVWLLIRISTNSFWASAVTGRIPEGCKWPLARAEIWKWKKKKERKRERSSNKVWLRFVLRVVHCIQKPFSVLKFKSIRWYSSMQI